MKRTRTRGDVREIIAVDHPKRRFATWFRCRKRRGGGECNEVAAVHEVIRLAIEWFEDVRL